jgi:trimethylamine--corrinoid protein Co-methyltransferase
MRSRLQLLDDDLTTKVIDEGISLLQNPGLEIHHPEIVDILCSAGSVVEKTPPIVKIPERIAREALASCPRKFSLYDLEGSRAVTYGTNLIHFNPGSSALRILDQDSQRARLPTTMDYVRFTKLVQMLPKLDAQSTALICSDVPDEIKDLYRLYLSLVFGKKPIVTGAFRMDTLPVMLELLSAAAGGIEELRKKPRAVFDICPSSPLQWSQTASQNLIDCARNDVPIQIIPMPIAGATAPVTIAGTLTQLTAECLSGLILAQLIRKGCRIVWGGSPVVFDMKHSTTPMGAVGSWKISIAYAQIGKSLGLPTQNYLGISDAKVLDAQCGMESALGVFLGAQAGLDMISGAGMLAFENCQSFEKLVLDTEIIGMARHFLQGIHIRDNPLAQHILRDVGHGSDFLSHEHTLRWFKEEFYYPSPVIERQHPDQWQENGSLTSWERAQTIANQQISNWTAPDVDKKLCQELRKITARSARSFGMDQLPSLPGL